MSTRELQLAEALAGVRKRLDNAAAAAGRTANEIELVVVTKFFPACDVAILARLGCSAFGESRDQEAAAKAAEVARLVDVPLRWHMVGQIQRNKARSIASWADTVHSVSSLRAVDALNRAAVAVLDAGGRQQALRIYVQMSLDGDLSRGGVDIARPELVDEVCARVAAADGLALVGLMGMPPLGADPADAFARLQAEHRRIQASHPTATQLSAGMSDDLEIAVRYGATCVRVGTAVLGRRPLTST